MSERGRGSQTARNIRAGGDVSVTQRIVNYFGRSGALPMLPPFSPSAGTIDGSASRESLLTSLRASERSVPVVGRGAVLEEIAPAWLNAPPPADGAPDHRALVIHGPAGAGKTRLAGEILSLVDSSWIAGFLSSLHVRQEDWPRIAHPVEPLVVAVDYAEARRADLEALFADPPVGSDGTAPLRLILIVREGKAPAQSWFDRLAGARDLGARADHLLGDTLEVVSLEESLPHVEHRREIWEHAVEAFSDTPCDTPAYLDHELFERPLFILLDAYEASPGIRDGDSVPPTASELLDRVLRHEQKYWKEGLADAGLDMDERRINQVAVIATLVGGVGRDAFEQALSSLPWLSTDEAERHRVSDWWCSIYGTAAGAVRGVEPDMVGEYLVVRATGEALTASDRLGGVLRLDAVGALVASTTLPGRQRILRVLTRMAQDEGAVNQGEAKTMLRDLLSRHLDDFLSEAFATPGPALGRPGVGESLATTVASAVLACDEFQLIAPRPADPDGSPDAYDDLESATRDAALRVVQRQVEDVAKREHEAGDFSAERYATVVAWALQIDLDADREERARERLEIVEGLDPRPHDVMARLYLTLARHCCDKDEIADAAAFLALARTELDQISEPDENLTNVMTHEAGRIAWAQGNLDDAREQFEIALEGSKRVVGVASSQSVAIIQALTVYMGSTDPDAAFDRLSQALDELEAAGAEDELLSGLRHHRPTILLQAGRVAMQSDELDAAESHLGRAMTEAAKIFPPEHPVHFVISHDIADVLAARGERADALTFLERALAGKSNARGAGHPDTVTTFLRLADVIAETDHEAALARVNAATMGLDIAGGASSEILRLAGWTTEALTSVGRLDEATALARAVQTQQVVVGIRRAILEAVADPTVLEHGGGVLAATPMCLLAETVFPPGDVRLAALTSRLSHLATMLVGSFLLSARLRPSERDEFEQIFEQGEAFPGRTETRERAASWLAGVEPEFADLGREMMRLLSDEFDRALEDPQVATLRKAAQSQSYGCLADDRAMRRWLADEALGGNPNDFEFIERIGEILSLYVATRLGVARSKVTGLEMGPVAERFDEACTVLATEREQTAEDLRATGLPLPNGLESLLTCGVASTFRRMGVDAERAGHLDNALRCYRRAIDEMGNADGLDDNPLRYLLSGDVADVTSATDGGDLHAAVELYDEAIAGLVRLQGSWHPVTIAVILRAADTVEKVDASMAKKRVQRTMAGLNGVEHKYAIHQIDSWLRERESR